MRGEPGMRIDGSDLLETRDVIAANVDDEDQAGANQFAYDSIFRPGIFARKVIVVTGGGSGIGRCTAHELASLGAVLALVGRKPEKLAVVAKEIAQDGGTATTYTCDIREEEQVKSTIARILAAHGRIDALVNNAGGQFHAPLASISGKGWDAVVRNNLTGGFLMARECFVQWMQNNGGAIVNIVADMWNGMPGLGHSGAARAGMVNFTETAAVEWAPAGVRVNAVAPGWIASSGMDTYPETRKPLIRRFARLIPMQRMGTEAEVSAAIVFLLSPAAAFISGATLRVDGAAPNARRQADLPKHASSPSWNGFHRYKVPDVLRDEPSHDQACVSPEA
jgi:citronellol/citronellal dehydrogenase